MYRTRCSASWQGIIPWVLFGIADDRYSKSSTHNRSSCTIPYITLTFWLASTVLIVSLKRKAYDSLGGQDPCWHTELLFRGARSPLIKILSNQLPCLCQISTHLAFWTTTVSGLLCCCIVTVTTLTPYTFWRRINDAWNPEVLRSRLALICAWNVEKLDVWVSINTDMLIPSGNVRVAIVLHLLITPLMRRIKPGDNLSDTRESPKRGFRRTSALSERGFDFTICCKMQTFDLIWNKCDYHHIIRGT